MEMKSQQHSPEGQWYPAGGQGYPPTSGQEYPPTSGQGYPPASGQGYPPTSGQGYPPTSGQGYPPASGQGYPPPSGQAYPPASGQGYPPSSGQGYPPPSGQQYPPPSGQQYPPPSGQQYPPASGQGYPPTSGQGYPPSSGQSGPASGGSPGAAPGAPQGAPKGAPVTGAGTGEASSTMAPFEPPPGFLDDIPGYDSITFDDIPLVPPRVDDGDRRVEPKDRAQFSGMKSISQEDAKTALLEHCSANCCYGKSAAEEMVIGNMSATTAFRYTLETFTEMRATAWAQVPFTGTEPLDTAMNGQPPQPWDIPLIAKEKFKDEKRLVEVPHTASVKPCHKCQGSGTTVCTACQGQGQKKCTTCSGKGNQTVGTETTPCAACGGAGRKERCGTCNGTGHAKCELCKGHRQLKWFVQLTITWANHLTEYIPERTSIPDAEIKQANGQVAFQEEQPWLFPVTHAPDPSIIKASADLIEKHKKAYPNERQLLQRQKIYIIPVTQVVCQWKETPFTFYVFGLESRVYSSDYPQKFCWGMCGGCTIL